MWRFKNNKTSKAEVIFYELVIFSNSSNIEIFIKN